ncbi:MAG TPA: helix-turn-helix domain-containing protein [Ramlibacter sp.]|nr:helix-turn-helix domain-containing protein [Ramlibacter sp.]
MTEQPGARAASVLAADDAEPDAEVTGGRSAHVQSVEVALQILEAIAESDGLVRVNSLARELGMTKAKVSRHLQTLLRLGLVAKGAQEGYTFGWKLVRLGRAATRDRSIGELSRPHLQRLRDDTGQTVILSLPVPLGAVVLQCVESLETTSVTVRTAATLSLPRSPAARLSAALQPPVRTAGTQLPPGSALKHWPGFGAEYEVDTGNGVGGVSVPVQDESGALVAIVSIVAPSTVLAPQPAEAMVRAMARCAAGIASDYTYGPAGDR